MRAKGTIGIGRLALVGLALLLTRPAASAQAVFGSIFGTVTDNTGAAVPKATVVVTDVAKGTSVTLTSNDSGEFTAEHLIPDTYNVKIELPGFKTFQQTDIRVFADSSVKVAAAMEVGSTGETVNVNADQVPLLKTDRADVSTTFSAQEIVDLPIPDRNFTNLQLLLPGAQLLGWSHAADENPQGSKQIEVDGQAFAGVAFQLDGTDNQDPILGIIVVNPNADSLSETKITTQNFDAEFGKAVSSVVTAQTKSGSNAFHGSAFDYRQSNANLARDPFTQPAGSPFPPGLRNQFGGSIGGPILKDKFFFFGDYQGVRQKVGISAVETVPTPQLVSSCLSGACDFSQYATAQGVAQNVAVPSSYQLIYNNASGAPVAYKNNVMSTALSPQALALLKLLQPYTPNTNSGGTFGALRENYAESGTGGFNSDQWDTRLDYTLSANIHAFARFSRFTDTLTGTTIFGPAGGAGFGLGGYGGSSTGANDSTAAGVDIALNSKLVTDIRAGYFRYNIITGKYDQGTQFATQLGIPGLNNDASFTSGAPGFILDDPGFFGATGQNGDDPTASGPEYGSGLNINRCNCELVEREDQFQLANNWTKTLGNHSVRFGADLRYARNLRVPSDNNRTGLLNFGTGPTGNGTSGTGLGFATFLQGDVTTFQRYVSTSTNAKEFQKRDFFYVQDTWRATQKLTVNYGLRYEMYFPESVNGKGNGAILNLNTGYLQVAGYGNINSDMNQGMANNAYNPRLGVAYQVNPGLVIRGGYGRSFDIGVFGSVFGHTATQNLPVLATQVVTAPNGDNVQDTGYAFTLAQGPSAPTPVTVPANGLLPDPGNAVNERSRPTTLRLPTLDAWNLSLQQSISPTMSFTIAYVGNKGTHTFGDVSGNTTNPNEPGDFLPANYSITGNALAYNPNGGDCYPAGPNCVAGGVMASGAAQAGTVLIQNGQTKNQTFLRRYYGGKLPACADTAYASVGGVNAQNGGCGWNQDLTYFGDNLDTHYNALQVTFTKQMAHGVSLNANYAWQAAQAYATGYSTWNRPAVYGNAGDLRRQQVIVYGLMELPFGKNKILLGHVNSVVNQVVSGWQISPVVNYSSGLPFTLNFSNCSASNVGDAPCYVSGDTHQFHKQVSGLPGSGLTWFPAFKQQGANFTAPGEGTFSQPAVDQIGSVGRNSFFGPNFFNTDLSVQKNFSIRERLTLQLRADAFNAFNHINWGLPGGGSTNIDQGGSISSGPYPAGTTGATRQMQFSGRVQF